MTLIMCSVEWVQPSSLGSNEKTSWYLARSDQAESTSSGGHDFKPLSPVLQSPLPLSYSQLRCLQTVRLLHPSGKLVIAGSSGTTVAATT